MTTYDLLPSEWDTDEDICPVCHGDGYLDEDQRNCPCCMGGGVLS